MGTVDERMSSIAYSGHSKIHIRINMIFLYIFFILNTYGVSTTHYKSSSFRKPFESFLATNEGLGKHSIVQKENRDGKLFSLFSIVQFKNDACRSSQSLSNTADTVARNGTCYSSTECSDKSGTAAGGCAAGFGVCCVFIYENSGSTISQNCSYLRNVGYPSGYTDTSSITATIQKCDPSVCYLRLDFESFDINGLSDSAEYAGAATPKTLTECQDKFQITSSAETNTLPIICGSNAGQHVYIDMGAGASDTAQLAFTFSGTYSRFYEIKVTQVECSNEYGQYPGCFQYHTGLAGRVETFNFANCPTQSHLPNQDYSICVRPEAGYDCVQWQICGGTTCGSATIGAYTFPTVDVTKVPPICSAFSLGTKADAGAKTSNNEKCSTDYIVIPGASIPCCQGANPQPMASAICGFYFNIDPTNALSNQAAICDCVAPYNIDVKFNDENDNETANMSNKFSSCGLCLEYRQVRC